MNSTALEDEAGNVAEIPADDSGEDDKTPGIPLDELVPEISLEDSAPAMPAEDACDQPTPWPESEPSNSVAAAVSESPFVGETPVSDDSEQAPNNPAVKNVTAKTPEECLYTGTSIE